MYKQVTRSVKTNALILSLLKIYRVDQIKIIGPLTQASYCLVMSPVNINGFGHFGVK